MMEITPLSEECKAGLIRLFTLGGEGGYRMNMVVFLGLLCNVAVGMFRNWVCETYLFRS